MRANEWIVTIWLWEDLNRHHKWPHLLGRAWASPTLAWLHCARMCVCLFVGLFVCLDRPLTVNFNWAHSNISRSWNVHADVYRTSAIDNIGYIIYASANNWDCSVAVKESESDDDFSWMHWQHTRQLCELWWESHNRVTRQATSGPWPVTVRQLNVRWLQVRAWHDRSYIAGIPLLAHSLTVKLSPCPYSHSSPAGRIAACLWAFQMQFATRSGSPQDDSASF